jgi:hypothetical protein
VFIKATGIRGGLAFCYSDMTKGSQMIPKTMLSRREGLMCGIGQLIILATCDGGS